MSRSTEQAPSPRPAAAIRQQLAELYQLKAEAIRISSDDFASRTALLSIIHHENELLLELAASGATVEVARVVVRMERRINILLMGMQWLFTALVVLLVFFMFISSASMTSGWLLVVLIITIIVNSVALGATYATRGEHRERR